MNRAAPPLPILDEHVVDVEAPVAHVWRELRGGLAAAFDRPRGRRLAAWLACREMRADRPFDGRVGATVPGFRVARVEPPRELALEGRHRFARYQLAFRIEPRGEGSLLRAETRARFPGVRGRIYRALVVASGGHRIVIRRILRGLARRAERRAKHNSTSREDR